MSRKERKQLAEEHLEFIQSLPDDQRDIVKSSVDNTRIFNIKVGYPSPLYERKYKETSIDVIDSTTIQAVLDEYKSEGLVTVLNFASAKHPGGGWLRGSMAQEESIASATTLYIPLSQSAGKMYKLNENDPKSGYYQDLIVYTPDVLVLRDDNGELLENSMCISVISVPSVNSGVVYEHAKKKRIDTNYTKKMIQLLMESRCTAILKVAAKYDTEVLILGAFGCGVFKNNPNDVAWIFSQLLDKTFGGVFKKVIFAIPNDKNMEVFSKIFK